MNYFSFARLQAGLKLVEPYHPRNFKPQVFVEEGGLFLYLSPSKTFSKKTIKQLETTGWIYDEKRRRIYFKAPDVNELLTHDDKNIRTQARRHMECLKNDLI